MTKLAWLFALAVTLHDLEEAIWLPAWARIYTRWGRHVDAFAFRLGTALITLLAYACAWWSTQGNAMGTYLLCGYALAMLLNVLVPHLIASVVFRAYSPGTGTALLCILPVSWLLLQRALKDQRVVWSTFAWAGPLVVLALSCLVAATLFAGSIRQSPR